MTGFCWKVRAGWYETEPQPAPGVRAIYYVDDHRPYWNVAEYRTSSIDGGLDLVSTGDIYSTLRDAKADNFGRPIEDGTPVTRQTTRS